MVDDAVGTVVVDGAHFQVGFQFADGVFDFQLKTAVRSNKSTPRHFSRRLDYPEFIRLPKQGAACPITGLSRAKLNELVLPNPRNKSKPPVASISLKQPGQIRGVRLIVVQSLLEYCHSAGLGGAPGKRDVEA